MKQSRESSSALSYFAGEQQLKMETLRHPRPSSPTLLIDGSYLRP